MVIVRTRTIWKTRKIVTVARPVWWVGWRAAMMRVIWLGAVRSNC